MGNKITKNANGFGYKYTDISEIHNWLEENGITYRQEVEVMGLLLKEAYGLTVENKSKYQRARELGAK